MPGRYRSGMPFFEPLPPEPDPSVPVPTGWVPPAWDRTSEAAPRAVMLWEWTPDRQ
jgi:hypothetical protein